MCIRKQDIAVLLLHRLGYSKVRNLTLRLRGKSVSRFVTFHDLPPESVELFRAHLQFLKSHTNVVSLDDHFMGRLATDRINVVITFDDGYRSWATSAAPILRDLGLPAAFFVASGFVGLSDERQTAYLRSNLMLPPDSAQRSRGLTVDDLRALAGDGFTIGGHTSNHCDLSVIRDAQVARNEIVEDKRVLEAMTRSAVDYFAYPFGAYANPCFDVASIVRESGYRGAVTTASGFNTPQTNPYLLHRELTPVSMAASVFQARTYGNYDAIRFMKRHLDGSRYRT
jgi:peptidoglycan/xylan/chitin deacetylase (PgdA/CDA1 family)